MQFLFGPGDMFGVPLIDANGNAVSNPTPIHLGVMQEMSLEFSGDIKEAYGQNSFALATARGKTKIAAKAKALQLQGAALNNLYFGQGMTAGTQGDVYVDTTGSTIPSPSGPYTITPTVPGTGTWVQDLGVTDSNGVAMTCVASSPATGQYSVSAGVYTFAAADAGKQVFINFFYTATIAGAKKIAVKNLPMGAAPSIKLFMRNTFQGKKALVVLYQAVAPKLALFATKLDDFSVSELDFSGQSDAANNVADIYVQE